MRRPGRGERALDLGRLGRRCSGIPKIGWLWLCGDPCSTYVERPRKETEKESNLEHGQETCRRGDVSPMSMPLVVVGAGGHAKVVIDTLREMEAEVSLAQTPLCIPFASGHDNVYFGIFIRY